MISNRNFALDLMKVLAVLFITNSHFIPLYKDVNPSFATFGVQGNALFFFVSGYLMMAGMKGKKNTTIDFGVWIAKKVRRLGPPVWLCVVAAAVLLNASIRWRDLVLADQYWFVQCIFIYYVLCYPLFNRATQMGGVNYCGLPLR